MFIIKYCGISFDWDLYVELSGPEIKKVSWQLYCRCVVLHQSDMIIQTTCVVDTDFHEILQ